MSALPVLPASLQYERVRRHSLALAAPLSAEDACAQSMPDASPAKWHLAHTTWFFETFILERHEPAFRPFDPAFRMLFNSYYDSIGERHPRPRRGLLTRPSLGEVLAWRANVDARMSALLASHGGEPAVAALATLGLQHEQQHQELLLTDCKHLLAQNPTQPAYCGAPLPPSPRAAAPMAWLAFEGGMRDIGHAGGGFCFDNELPCHPQYVAPFALASRLVTNGEYLEFIEAGGYRDSSLWLAEGWDAVCAGMAQPLYWRHGDEGWTEFTLHGRVPLDTQRPVVHLSLYEADAYARFRGARLPTEAELELGCALPPPGRPSQSGEPRDAGGPQLHPSAAAAHGLAQLFGACWQWTSSSYAPYPGFSPAPGAVGEYNGKFMVNQYVLRGSSCATPAGHARASYRNFFPAASRWQFTGIRLAMTGA